MLALASCASPAPAPDGADTPDISDTPESPEAPNTPAEPDTPDTPDEPETPVEPDTPGTPDEPDNPDQPDEPDNPGGPFFTFPVPGTGDGDDDEDGDGTPSLVPGFPGGIQTPGVSDVPDVAIEGLADGEALSSDLEALVSGNTGDVTLESSPVTDELSWRITNLFPGITVPEGTVAAIATPPISSNAHAAVLFEVADGVDAEAFAGELNSHADPRWMICSAAESVQYKVAGNRILFVMSSAEIADTLIAAFNG